MRNMTVNIPNDYTIIISFKGIETYYICIDIYGEDEKTPSINYEIYSICKSINYEIYGICNVRGEVAPLDMLADVTVNSSGCLELESVYLHFCELTDIANFSNMLKVLVELAPQFIMELQK